MQGWCSIKCVVELAHFFLCSYHLVMFDNFSFFSSFSVGRGLRRHTTLLVSFLPYPSKAISSVTLDLLITLGFPFISFSVSEKMKIVRTCVSFFFKLLHQYSAAFQPESKFIAVRLDEITRLKSSLE